MTDSETVYVFLMQGVPDRRTFPVATNDEVLAECARDRVSIVKKVTFSMDDLLKANGPEQPR